jgi:hypothetical protein
MRMTNISSSADPRYSKRLAIVVPYRDRAEHLAKFVPHLAAYFQRDKLDRQIAVTNRTGRGQHAEIPSGGEKTAGAANHAGFAKRLSLHC